MVSKRKLEQMIAEAVHQLEARNIKLRRIHKPTVVYLGGRRRVLPPHNERAWFAEYFKENILEKSMTPEQATRESYALLRYKQDLAGMSDGSNLAAMFGLMMGGVSERPEEVYHTALEEYDTSQISKR